MKKTYKLGKDNEKSPDFSTDNLHKLTKLYKENKQAIGRLSQAFSRLSDKEILGLIKSKDSYSLIPASIFESQLSPLESIVKHLKENLDLNFHKIAVLLNRDDRTVWTTYNNSVKKKIGLVVKDEHLIPLIVFSDRRLSILENLAVYLKKELGFSLKEISVIIKKDPSTVWTAYHRALKKLKNAS